MLTNQVKWKLKINEIKNKKCYGPAAVRAGSRTLLVTGATSAVAAICGLKEVSFG